MTVLSVEVSCTACGHDTLEVINVGTPIAGTETMTILACERCTTEFTVTAHLRQHGPNKAHKLRREEDRQPAVVEPAATG